MRLTDGLETLVRCNEPLAPHTWLRVGGAAEYFAQVTTLDEVRTLVHRCAELELPIRVLGSGSNVLVRDEGVPGLVLRLAGEKFSQVRIDGDVLVAAGGASLGHAITEAVRAGLAGLEQLVGIPGTIGGALHGNAGAQGHDIGQWIDAATVMTRTGDAVVREQDEMQFAYRQSSLDELMILEARFALRREDAEELTRRMQKLWILRRASQPLSDEATAWMFKNPRAIAAKDLIEQAGLKGARVGNAEVSERHPNFVLAHPGATSSDVLRLLDLVRSRVSERLGVDLETAIDIW